MQYKDILVYLDDGKSNAERIATAFSIAESQNARLTGVTLAALKPANAGSKNKSRETVCTEEAEKRIEAFNALAKETGLEYSSKIITGKKKEARLRLSQYARNFDLVIFRQANPESKNFELIEKIASKIVVLCGRPVFFMPYIGAHHIPCTSAMVAWDGTPAASRAVHDALPLLRVIDKVIITVVRKENGKTAKGELLADDLVAHLKRHDVNASVNRINAGSLDVATILLNEISDHSIDLLVMGGYGTPNIRQKVFGGVTETMLKMMVTPILMSH